MTRSEFVDSVARRARLSRAAAERVVSAIFDNPDGAIADAVQVEGSLSLPGFGTFTRRRRSTRSGRPRNGASNHAPNGPAIGFTPAPAASVNGASDLEEEGDADVITPEEAAIRRRLVKGFEAIQGMEIENLFPGGWADDPVRS